MEQTSAPPTWACAPVREGVRQSRTGGCRRLGTWSPCVSSDVPLSRVTASPPPPLPGSRHWRQRVRPFGPGLAQTDTWCCCCCCVRSPAAAAAREETKRAAVQTPRKLCSPRRSLLWWCETVSVVSRSQCCVCAFWCEMTGRTRTTARTRQHYIPGQIDTVRPGQHHTAGSSEEGSDLIWCRPSCCATNPADQARPHTGRKHSPT